MAGSNVHGPSGLAPDGARGNLRTPRHAALASWIGSALEYYDFFIYATAAALVFGQLFFPTSEPSTGILLAFATFGIGYVVRPAGALILGHLGDRFGRKRVLVFTLNLMGGSTFLVGCLPTYDQIGLTAPILLTVLQIGQGFSTSGEQASAISVTLEHSPLDRRAFFTSFTMSGTQAGLIGATLVFIPLAQLPNDEFAAWGWRVPFWLSAGLVVVGYWVRRTLRESPVFQEEDARSTVARAPLQVLFRHHWRAILRVAGGSLVSVVSAIFGVFSLSFAVNVIGIERATMLWVVALANVVALAAIPAWAIASDRFGRKPIALIGILVPGLLMVPYLWAVARANTPLIFLFSVLMSGVFFSAASGVLPSFNAEMFPSNVRLSGVATGTQLAIALTGLTPAIAAAIMKQMADSAWLPVACLTLGICVVAAIAIASARETYRVPIDLLGNRTDIGGRWPPS